jgi:hypothetical protein
MRMRSLQLSRQFDPSYVAFEPNIDNGQISMARLHQFDCALSILSLPTQEKIITRRYHGQKAFAKAFMILHHHDMENRALTFGPISFGIRWGRFHTPPIPYGVRNAIPASQPFGRFDRL